MDKQIVWIIIKEVYLLALKDNEKFNGDKIQYYLAYFQDYIKYNY